MTVSCIIPAYNEGGRIGKVLDVVVGHKLISEVIVVDDGSIDDTRAILINRTGIKVIYHEKNLGKSAAMITGIQEAQFDLLLFLDSDLIGLKSDDIENLVEPVIEKISDVSISIRSNSPFIWRWIGLDYISGERVIPRRLVSDYLPAMVNLRPFGFEVFINSLIIEKKLKVSIVKWDSVVSPIKTLKYGIWKGIRGDIKMMRDIFSVVSPVEVVYQIFRMLSLKVT